MSEPVPPLSDPSWPLRSAPLLHYLREPRSWAAIESWCAARVAGRMSIGWATHCIAWAEQAGLVRSVVVDGAIRWVATGIAPERGT